MTMQNSLSKKSEIQTINGIIQPCSYNPQRVALFDNDTNKEYCILPKGAGVDLLDYVSENMELKGIITSTKEDEDEKYQILVRFYQTKEETI